MHLVVGFESQIAAHGAALAVAHAARGEGVLVVEAALARVDAGRGMHVNRVSGFELPVHVLGALDRAVDPEDGEHPLAPGQTALVVASSVCEPTLARIARDALLDEAGALWVKLVQVD